MRNHHSFVYMAMCAVAITHNVAAQASQQAECRTSWPGWKGVKYMFTLYVFLDSKFREILECLHVGLVVIPTRKQDSIRLERSHLLETLWETRLIRE
jgi:hypothetical protein